MTNESKHPDTEIIKDTFGVQFNAERTLLIKAPETLSGHYTVPDGVTTIGKEAFCRCWDLTGITMPESVTIIEYGAFWNCGGLTRVDLSPNITTMGDYAFWCDSFLT